MRRISLVFLFFLTTIIFSCQSNTSQIKDSFDEYKSAIINRDGKTAVKFIDKATIDYYSRLLVHVKNLDSSQLEMEPSTEKFETLKIRHVVSKKQILEMNGTTLLITLINHGISNNGNIDKYTLGKITIKGDSGQAEKISNHKATPLLYLFSKEEGSWKIRMHASNPVTDIVFKQLALDRGLTENDYIFKLLGDISGARPSQAIWKPIN